MAKRFVLGAKYDVDPAIIIEVLSGSCAGRAHGYARPRAIKEAFEPGFKAPSTTRTSISSCRPRRHVPLPATAVAHELFSALMAGRGDLATRRGDDLEMAGIEADEGRALARSPRHPTAPDADRSAISLVGGRSLRGAGGQECPAPAHSARRSATCAAAAALRRTHASRQRPAQEEHGERRVRRCPLRPGLRPGRLAVRHRVV